MRPLREQREVMNKVISPETFIYNPEKRLYDDATTWLAEAIDGSMNSEFAYHFDGQELYAEDGSPLGKIFYDALEEADRLPPNLYFEAERRQLEFEEYQQMLVVAQGDLPNTMVVISDFPNELADADQDIGGYNVTRRQAMLRVVSKRSDGSMKIQSQSLDGSDRQALEGLYRHLGAELPSEGGLLGQRVHLQMEGDTQQELLIDSLRNCYDSAMTAKTGKNYYAGIEGGSPLNTFEFVKQQTDIIDYYLGSVESIYDNQQLKYAVVSAINERFEKSISKVSSGIHHGLYEPLAVHPDLLVEQVWQAAARASANNRVFSGCGGSISFGLDQSGGQELALLGYGNKTNEKQSYSFNKLQHCVVCQAPPEEGEQKKMCGPCGICRSCDAKL